MTIHAVRGRTRYPGTIDPKLRSAAIPLQISGCVLWLAADTIAGLNDDDPVGTWADLSGNGNDVAQATAGYKPLYKTAILNSLPVVRFDGIDDRMMATFALNQPVQQYVVCIARRATPGGNERIIDGAVGRCGMNIANSRYIYADAGTSLSSVSQITKDVPFIARGLLNGANSKVEINNVAYRTGNAGTTNAGGVLLAKYTSGSFYGQVDIAEVCVYNAEVSTADETALLAYLNGKWAVY